MPDFFNMVEVIELVNDGITRDHIYYMEKKGFIKPKMRRAGHAKKRQMRSFTEEHVGLIRLIWKHKRAGYEWGKAFDLAQEERTQGSLF